MKINISIEGNPAELAELLKATQGERDVVQEALDYLEKKISNQVAYHVPADHMETGTVIQGKPPHGIDSTGEPEFHVGDLVELHWEGKKSDSPNVLYFITELHDNGTVSLRPNTFPSFEGVNISKEWISRPFRKVELRGDDEWIMPNADSPQPTPPRPMRDPSTRIQTGDHVIVQPFTGYNEIFTVLAANNGRALLLGEIGEEEIQELSNLLPVWPDSEGNYCFHRNDTAAEPPKE